MRIFILTILCTLFYAPIPLHATTEPLNFDHVKATELLLELGIINKTISGGVVVVGTPAGILASSARGKISTAPEAPPIDDQTVFDLASLTKVIATSPAVMKLVDAGKVSLQDPLVKWFPEFKGSKRERITITHLLTHTSGLVDFELNADQTVKSTIARAAAETGSLAIGTFNYADLNFILLGELVKRVSGKSLDTFCRDELYAPLQAPTLTFLPPTSVLPRVAPTSGNLPGIVQDQNSRKLGGVAGHAGLFSSAEDLSKFARMMLGNGELEGRRILSEQAVRQMVAPLTCGATVVRGLGWDIQSSYSAPKGKLCSAGSYGHSGYSGSSIWIDPAQDLFVIILTNRVNYQNVGAMRELRSNIATVAAAEFGTLSADMRPVIILASAKLPVILQSAKKLGPDVKRVRKKVSAAHKKNHNRHVRRKTSKSLHLV